MHKISNNIDCSKLLGFRLIASSKDNSGILKRPATEMNARISAKIGGKPNPR